MLLIHSVASLSQPPTSHKALHHINTFIIVTVIVYVEQTNSLCNQTPVSSGNANGISSQLFVDILWFIKMMALVFPG